MRAIHGFHPFDYVVIRLAPNDTGSVIVIGNQSTGMTVLLSVQVNLTELQPEMSQSERK